MKKFTNEWNGTDDLDLHISVRNFPEDMVKYPLADECVLARCKVEEGDSGCLDENTMADMIWKNHPANMYRITESDVTIQQEEPVEDLPEFPVDKKRERYIASKHAEDRKRKIEPLTMSIRPTRNGGIKPSSKSGVHGYMKRYDRRVERYSAKEEVRDADLDADLYMPSFWDDDDDWHLREEMAEFSSETSDGRVWHDADKIAEQEYDDDYDDDDDEDWDEDEWFSKIRELKQQIAVYKDFIGYHRLTKLFDDFCESNDII